MHRSRRNAEEGLWIRSLRPRHALRCSFFRNRSNNNRIVFPQLHFELPMNSPHNIYGLEGPAPGSSSTSAQSQAGGANAGNAGYQQQSGYPPYPPYQNVYYQQPSVGCGTYLFRFAVGGVLLFVGGFLMIFFLGVLGLAMSGSIEQVGMQEKPLSEKLVQGDWSSKSKVAIISINGMIMESENGYIPKQIKQVLKDKDVKAVVLRVDSPGGTMTGSDYYLYLLKEMKSKRNIPVIVSMGSMAASGGYYVSMVGDEIYAEPTTITGSIGVIVPMYKGVGLCEKIGVESTPITSGPLKTMGSFDKPLTDEQKAVWQALVDDNFKRFKNVIIEGRENFNADPKKLDDLATGQIYTATEAEENGLIDKIGYLDDAIAAAMKKAGLSENTSKTIRYRPKMSFMEAITEAKAPKTVLDTRTLFNLTSPKVYLLEPNSLPL